MHFAVNIHQRWDKLLKSLTKLVRLHAGLVDPPRGRVQERAVTAPKRRYHSAPPFIKKKLAPSPHYNPDFSISSLKPSLEATSIPSPNFFGQQSIVISHLDSDSAHLIMPNRISLATDKERKTLMSSAPQPPHKEAGASHARDTQILPRGDVRDTKLSRERRFLTREATQQSTDAVPESYTLVPITFDKSDISNMRAIAQVDKKFIGTDFLPNYLSPVIILKNVIYLADQHGLFSYFLVLLIF